jgi:hypothetical protein
MNVPANARFGKTGRALISAVVGGAFFWALILSVSPGLHQWIHNDANQIEHTCAVTMIAAGNFNHVAPAPLVCAPVPVTQFASVPVLNSQWVEPLFLSACIFEHAPPANS